ncbi:MAG: cupin domain-containing protein [Oscillatoriales cyanobacterium SM2_2_1]|nr:cupin domain-containing protein [Oscillatoriales cyanobacterium SM2_2_1]
MAVQALSSRIFNAAQYFQPVEGEPIRSVVVETAEAAIIAWYLLPGQEIAPHIHPHGQDSWTILQGEGLYYLSASEQHPVAAGDVTIAPVGQIHGVRNTGIEPLILISTVTPSEAGYLPIAMVS